MKRIIFLFILPAIALASEAAGGHHQPSVKDLIAPAVNFTLIFGFLIWKLKKPVAQAFARYAETVEEIFHQAKDNQRMAETRKAEVAEKMNGFEALKVSEKERLAEELNLFKVDTAKDTAEHIEKMKQDADARLEYEKQQLLRHMNNELVDKIIDEAKQGISSNPNIKKNITERLVSKL